MSAAYAQYNGDGVTRTFVVPFPYFAREHVQVSVDAVVQSGVGWINDGLLETSTAPAVGKVVDVRRVTPTGASPVDFEDGSVLTEADLDLLARYSGYLAEESRDYVVGALRLGPDGSYNADARRMSNLADGTQPGDAMTYRQFTTQVAGPITASKDAAQAAAIAAANSASAAATSATTSTAAAQSGPVQAIASDLVGVAYKNGDLGSVADAATAPTSTPAGSIKTVADDIASVRSVATRLDDILDAATETLAAYDSLVPVAASANAAKTAAETAATNAAASASAASTSQGAASTAATTASTAATNANAAKTAAETAATNAAASATSILGAVAASAASADAAADSAADAADSAALAQAASAAVQDAAAINADYYPILGATATGTVARKTSAANLKFHPSTGLLSATKFAGDGSTLTNIGQSALASTLDLGSI